MTKTCLKCGAQAAETFAFCESCGAPLPPAQAAPTPAPVAATCPKCGTAAAAGFAFCENCGAPLRPAPALAPVESTAPVASPPPAAPVTATATAPTVDMVKLRDLFNQAVAVGPPWPDRVIEQACDGDTALANELKRLLAARSAMMAASAPPLAPSATGSVPMAPPLDPSQAAPAIDSSSAPYSPPSSINASTIPYTQPQAKELMIGPYRVVRELGRGGMGVVFLAVRDDGAFRKNVAVKVLLRDQANDEFVQRFKQERQVLAALDHPNIARILDGGDAPDGTPYYVMEFVEGVPIDAYCDQHRLSLNARVKVFQQVCRAVHYLHQNSILHRDLKPGNILVSGDDVVKLLDFGIAKVTGAAAFANPDLTSAQGRPMTPNYASPEQISGATLKPTSDIYSLGVILYRLLTGRLPYEGLDDKIAKIAARESPPLPSANIREDLKAKPETTQQLRRAMLGDLDAIVLKAMKVDPKERYESAGEFADDLQRFLDGQDVTALQSSMARKSVRMVKRKRLAIGVLVAFLVVAAFGIVQWRRVETEKTEVAAREEQIQKLLSQLETRQIARQAAPDEAAAHPDEIIQDLQKLKQAFATDYTAAAARRPGMSPERTALLERGVKYLDEVQKTAPQQAGVGLQIADGYQQLAVLREKTTGTDPASRTAALKTYQKAATVLAGTADANPTDAAAQDRLRNVNQRIEALGGTAITVTVQTPPPAAPVDTPPSPAPVMTSAPKKTPVVAAAPPPVQTPPPPPQAAPVAAPPAGPAISAADQAELDERMISVSSKIQVADQAVEPYRQNLAKNGQMLTADILNSQSGMHTALDRAKRQMAAGNAAAAKESLGAAEAYATKLLRAVGR